MFYYLLEILLNLVSFGVYGNYKLLNQFQYHNSIEQQILCDLTEEHRQIKEEIKQLKADILTFL